MKHTAFTTLVLAALAGAPFIKTIAGRNFLVCFRFYGAEDAFYDQTWKPNDIEKAA